jgi:hypothetical protein
MGADVCGSRYRTTKSGHETRLLDTRVCQPEWLPATGTWDHLAVRQGPDLP